MRDRRLGTATVAFLVAASLAGCSLFESGLEPSPAQQVDATGPTASPTPTVTPSPTPSPTPTPDPAAEVRTPGDVEVAPGADAVTLALAASRAFWAAAPLVVVSRAGDADALAAAEEAGVPLLVTGKALPVPVEGEGAEGAGTEGGADGEKPADAETPADPPADASVDPAVLAELHAEIDRLGTEAVLAFDPTFEVPEGLATEAGTALADRARPAQQVPDAALLTDGTKKTAAAAHTARAAGAQVFTSRSGDPRAARELLEAYASGAGPARVVAVGDRFGDLERLTARMAPVRTGVTLPHGSQLVFDDARYVALYGSPLTPALGVLGEQSVKRSVSRARQVAKPYRKLVDEQVVPMFEIIVTVASAGAGKDGDYSNELDPEQIRPYVELAKEKGVYVLLDLQPGRTDFLTQAKLYEEFLREPHVGLALDPEWRLKKHQVHLRQIGSVGIKEVNRVADWLAGLVAEDALPQKMFVLHQFTSSMIRNRHRLDVSHPELATVIHVDGQGALGSKYGTWAHLRKGAPEGVHWGWKNFYDEDVPMATPKQTVAVDPTPDLVTYQ